MSSLDERPFPRGALIGAGLLIASSLAGVGLYQYTKFSHPPSPGAIDESQIVQSRDLRFFGDPRSGPMIVYDAVTGEKIADLRPNDGFVRTVLVSMAFDRGRQGITSEPTYRLLEWADSRITIEDTTTKIRMNIGAFGTESKAVFGRFFANKS
jgi:putative photosynthetic complex assembly protein